MSRVAEEERRRGPVRGVTVALDRIGPLISSCGVIIAGTFASLLGGSLTDMKPAGHRAGLRRGGAGRAVRPAPRRSVRSTALARCWSAFLLGQAVGGDNLGVAAL